MDFNVISVIAHEDRSLILTFEDGKHGRFDMAPYLERKPWAPIKPLPRFMQAAAVDGTVIWPGNIDMSPEILHDSSIEIEEQHRHGSI